MVQQMNDGYSICFNQWALDKEIKNELGLLLIISSLSAERGYCYANNDYLAELFNEPVQTISRKLKKLKDRGYITIEYEKRGCEVKNRKLRLTKLLTDGYQNCYSTINKNVKYNNIIYNNTINNNIYTTVIDYLNEKTGKHFKCNTNKTKSVINARINEGFVLEDFKTVIDNKCNEWLDTNMSIYLRPETLFGNKFEGYLNQGKTVKSVQQSNKEFFARKRKEIEDEQK